MDKKLLHRRRDELLLACRHILERADAEGRDPNRLEEEHYNAMLDEVLRIRRTLGELEEIKVA